MSKDFLQEYFHADFKGIDSLLNEVLVPIFGDVMPGYTEITATETMREKARGANIQSIKHAATLWADGYEIKVFDVTLHDKCHIHIARKNIQTLIRQYVEHFEGALIAFHYANPEKRSWRLSYLEKRSSNNDSTSAKRYTYLCGRDYACRTIAERFAILAAQEKNAINIDNAFSVEALSNEFFAEYKNQYSDFCNYIIDNRTDETKFGVEFATCEDKFIRDYVKKMMGRLTFLHFLQKKGWMGQPRSIEGWGEGNINFLHDLFNKASDEQKDNFLDEILEPLFFECLNEKRDGDFFDTQVSGIRIVKIPYLNGGLFEKDSIDAPRSQFPREMFQRLFDFYGRYNFTIDENDPLDTEVGVDPEMLGKIFENLLEDNKDKGAFYTPKEIVQYMCKEALIAYLVGEAKKKSEASKQSQVNFEEAIRAFVNDPELTVPRIARYSEKQLHDLKESLENVKICDPAIGSGAFPMGLLNLLVSCREAINAALRCGEPRSYLKQQIILNNIYGVDIEKGAIDIARLRFWLSIVVDEDEPTPLPNFDYKFMQGNSLLEQFEGLDLSNMFSNTIDLHHKGGKGATLLVFDEEATQRALLREKMNHYFTLNADEDKHDIRKQVNKAVVDLVKEKTLGKSEMHEKLDALDVSANEYFFLWHTWFAEVFEQGGFDIVIGNPPWGADLSASDKLILKNIYTEIDSSTPNSYAYFVGLGLRLSKTYLSFVLPDSILIKDFKKTRELLSKSTNEVIWYQNCGVPRDKRMFRDVEHDICIISADKSPHNKVHIQTNNFLKGQYVPDDSYPLRQDFFREEFDYVFNLKANEADWQIATKILKNKPLDSIAQCHEGIHSGNVREKLFLNTFRPGLKPMFYGGRAGDTIKPYVSYMNGWFVDYREDIIDYDAGEYASLRDERLFIYPKIYITRTGNPFKAFYDESSYASNNFFSLQIKDYTQNTIENLEYILPFINSKVCQFFIRKFAAPRLGESFIETKIIHLLKFPIPEANSNNRAELVRLVDSVITCKNSNPNANTSDLEKQIDELVYDLYGLSDPEKEIVRNS